MNYTCASHFYRENAFQNKNVPLIACLSLSKSYPESGEKHTCAHTHTHTHAMNYYIILIAARYILFPYISLSHSLTPYFSHPSSDRAEKRNCKSLPIDWPRERLRKETSRRDLAVGAREGARSNRGQRQERDDEIRLPAAHSI